MGRICYVNGTPYLVALPAGGQSRNDRDNQWNQMISCLTSQKKDLDCINWKNIFSLCQEKTDSGWIVSRGSDSAYAWSCFTSEWQSPGIGFRPIFIPLNPRTMQPDPSILDEIPDGERISFGSYYINNKIATPPKKPTRLGDIPNYKLKADISFGSLQIGYGFHVIKMSGWLIADRILVKNISWENLKDLGYTD